MPWGRATPCMIVKAVDRDALGWTYWLTGSERPVSECGILESRHRISLGEIPSSVYCAELAELI